MFHSFYRRIFYCKELVKTTTEAGLDGNKKDEGEDSILEEVSKVPPPP